MRLGRGCLLAKTDFWNAFRLCPVHPADCHLLGIAWQGRYYHDKVLPFGLRSVPFIFNQRADMAVKIAVRALGTAERPMQV